MIDHFNEIKDTPNSTKNTAISITPDSIAHLICLQFKVLKHS